MLRDPILVPLSHQHHNGLALCVMTRRSLAADSSAQNVAKLADHVRSARHIGGVVEDGVA